MITIIFKPTPQQFLLRTIAIICIMIAITPATARTTHETTSSSQSGVVAKNETGGPKKSNKKQSLATRSETKNDRYTIDPKYLPQEVTFSGYAPGTIVIDQKQHFLYLVITSTTARRYGVGVGKQSQAFQGKAIIKAKREWPRWIPTKAMIERDPARYGRLRNGLDGGPGNPLGSRALYLYQGNKDTYIRIHGTIQPWTVGRSVSSGCFRMINEDVMDLYDRVSLGTHVVVL
ncbi:hypothetical protein CQ054_22485 [Ochrobactrum sp. MYb29]|uniref:L,D-transpeptidase n=1 Tax=Brucella pituitosa TaxID=571256 RepID=UPI000C26FB53|nr:L,D-transpeptidase [Brucella pituitosa]PJO49338.1 L,D-transpeptidase [Brucella pituitosa]PRA78233.1 hypothetical protein CQ054_22485 [Ochrobactrum sp. MYb29]